MRVITVTLLFLTLGLGACNIGLSPTEAAPIPITLSPTTDTLVTETPTPTPAPLQNTTVTDTFTPLAPAETPTDTPTAVSSYEQCGYMWAYQDLPSPTKKLNDLVSAINPQASARAQAFGENCVYADGHSTFGAIETDYYVQLQVEDLTNEEALGNWIAQVMPLIDQLPQEEILGPQPGFVEFSFIRSETERIIFRVPIQNFDEIAQGKTGVDLFRFFYIPLTRPT